MKLTFSEAGKLGGAKTKELTGIKMEKIIIEYNQSPNICKHCKSALPYNKKRLKFCNNSCSASFYNEKRRQEALKVSRNCLNCNKELVRVSTHRFEKRYCNLKCYGEYRVNQKIIKWLDGGKSWNGQLPGRVKKYIASIRGYKCQECNISEWNCKPITLECDHIDGHHENNNINNLRLICPNCHSQTSTYKAKNKGNGRTYRNKPGSQNIGSDVID